MTRLPLLKETIMDKKHFTIGILSLTAVILFVANLLVPQRAAADFSIKDRDYSAVTASLQANDEGIYILDNRSGTMALFSYDPNARGLIVRSVAPVTAAFANPGR